MLNGLLLLHVCAIPLPKDQVSFFHFDETEVLLDTVTVRRASCCTSNTSSSSRQLRHRISPVSVVGSDPVQNRFAGREAGKRKSARGLVGLAVGIIGRRAV